jgi:hypothetical protein
VVARFALIRLLDACCRRAAVLAAPRVPFFLCAHLDPPANDFMSARQIAPRMEKARRVPSNLFGF